MSQAFASQTLRRFDDSAQASMGFIISQKGSPWGTKNAAPFIFSLILRTVSCSTIYVIQ